MKNKKQNKHNYDSDDFRDMRSKSQKRSKNKSNRKRVNDELREFSREISTNKIVDNDPYNG